MNEMHPVSTHEQPHDQSTTASSDNNKEPLPFQTPPIRPTPPPQGLTKTRKSTSSSSSSNMSARRKISPMPSSTHDQEDEDYNRFVQSLAQDDPMMSSTLHSLLLDEDEEDFVLTDLEDEEEDDDDILNELAAAAAAPSSPGATAASDNQLLASPLLLEPSAFYSELEAELGSLLEEDLEAAVSTLLATSTKKKTATTSTSPKTAAAAKAGGATTPLREATSSSSTARLTQVTPQQVQRLQKLLESHYQLLVQSSVLGVRAARKEYPEESPLVFHGGESPEDLTEVLDGAVGMLQDLDQNRKDAIRNYIQRCETTPQAAQRSLLPQYDGNTNKRLTRSAFHSLYESTNAQTMFDVDGLYALKQTFYTIDHCGARQQEGLDILQPVQHFDACRQLLEQAGAKIDTSLLPGKNDLSNILCDPREVFGEKFKPPTSIPQQIQLRRSRNQFTAAEDNLVLRGVNLYGEKQWILIADRYMPDRSVNIISQRYSKLCLLLYKAHGIKIDKDGNLPTPPRFDKVDDLDEVAISKIKPASAPAILNVHRWSLEEDVTLLKAVPLLGNQWAELSSRLIPHRDRGHLRKRYQVLERRVKATVTRNKRGDVPIPRNLSAPSNAKPPSRMMPTTTTTNPSRKRKAEPTRPMIQPHPGSIIRGPVPAHMLCPTNASGANKRPAPDVAGRKTMEFSARRTPTSSPLTKPPRPHESGVSSPGMQNRAHAHPGGYVHPNGGYVYPNGYVQTNGGYAHANGGGFAHSPSPYAPKSPGYPHASPGRELSHEASKFENILSETTNDWSQMSRMKQMMHNETESMVADAIVNSLATGSNDPLSAQNADRLPPLQVHSSSGLSNSNVRESGESREDPATPPKEKQNGRLMASVLERIRKDEPQQDVSPGEEKSRAYETLAAVPSTPSRQPQQYAHSSYGTPLGVSPGAGLQMRTFYSPGGAHHHHKSPGYSRAFSPGEGAHSFMMGGAGENSNDYQLYPFELTEGSRQAIADSPGASTVKPDAAAGLSHPPTPCDIFQDSHPGLKSTDLEAISALNSLSNSPAKFLPAKRPASSGAAKEGNVKTDTTKKSLFEKAVGALEQKGAYSY